MSVPKSLSDVESAPVLGIAVHQSLRYRLTIVAIAFALSVVGLVWYASHEFKALSQLTAQLNSAGRLRMLSQHAALLTKRAAQGDEETKRHLYETIREFDESLDTLGTSTLMDEARSDTDALDRIATAWDGEKSQIDNLVRLHYVITDADESELATLAAVTLAAAEDNTALFFPRVKRSENIVQALLPLSVAVGGLLVAGVMVFIRRSVLHPMGVLEALMEKLAHGELSARAHVGRLNEIGRVLQHANSMAKLLERNAAERSETLTRLGDSESRHRTLWEMSADAIVTIDSGSVIVFANPAVQSIFGHESADLIGKDIGILQPEHLREAHRIGMSRYLTSGVSTVNWSSIETQALHKDGRTIDVELSFTDMKQSSNTWLVGTFRDISDRKRQEEALERSANFDGLTGLPNRVLLHDRIEQAIASAKRRKSAFGVLYLDLDNFKIINDTLGHECGDLLLCEAAKRLLTVVRDDDTVARIGGDEFVLLLSELQTKQDIDIVAQRTLSAMAAPFNLSGKEGYVGVSIGASVFPDDAEDRVNLLQYADIAMYRAKDMGRNNYQRYAEQMQARFKWRMSMDAQLRRAIEADELVLHYQPQIDLRSGRVVGAEALIRWESPSLGRVSPAQFIPLAEETGLIVPIGKWVIERACRDAASWIHTPEGKDCVIAVNVSARQLNGSDLIDIVSSALSENQLAPGHIELEITESLVMQNPENANALLNAIRDLGCKVALDDFGTGYSSLAYLRNFPIDCLKIDKSLINDVAIVRAVIQLAGAFGFSTLAEGVEDEAVLSVLKSLGCDFVQGYYYSRPIAVAEFREFLRNHVARETVERQ